MFTTPRKKKQKYDEEDDDEDEDTEDENANVPDDEEFVASNETVSTRGTILITLRNVSPYTQWYAFMLSFFPSSTHSLFNIVH